MLRYREVIYFQVPAARKMRDSCLKAHLHLSVEAEGFLRREGEQNKEIKGGGCNVLYVQLSTVHPRKASDGPV